MSYSNLDDYASPNAQRTNELDQPPTGERQLQSATPRGHWPSLAPEHRYRSGVNVLLTLEKPCAETTTHLDRGERYRRLMAHAEAQRRQITAWIAEQGLTDEIMRVGEANSFHLLFIYCTPAAAERLAGAPGVIDVALAQPA
jgi:hypothetical protein